MHEQKLNLSKVLGPSIGERRFRSAHHVGTIRCLNVSGQI